MKALDLLSCSPLTCRLAALRLSGANAKDHAVFAELTRVRQYFEKIKKIETPPEPREKSLNTTAAIRFLKADLVLRTNLPLPYSCADLRQSDNQKIKNKLNEQLAKEKAKAEAQLAQRGKKRRAEESPKRERSGLDSGNSGQPGQGARLSKHNRRQEEQ